MSRFKSAWFLLVVLACIGRAESVHAQALTLPIGPTLNGALGVNTFTLQASGGTPPYHYSITPGFTAPAGFRVQDGPPLPTNFTVNPNGTGGFLGVAATSGTFTTSIRVTDAAATVLDKPITLNIPPLQFSINPPKLTLNVAYSYTFTGFGGSGGSGYSWSATNLPTGMTLSPGGVLSGTPTAIPVGNAVVTLTDSTLSPPLNSLQRQVTITVDPFAITTPGLLPTATAGVFYSETITAPGCPAPCSFTPTAFAGLTLNSAGVLSGTPFLQTGSFTVTATGAGPVSVSKQFTLFVTSPSTPLSSGFTGFGDQTVGNFITASVLPFGGTPPYTVSVVSGALPNGISLVGPGDAVCNNCNPGLMYLSGRAMAAGTYNFTLQFQDSAANTFTPAAYTWNISTISNSYFTLPLVGTTLTVGTPYTQPLLAFGGSNSYTFQAFNALPAGLSIDTNTGVISGTPTTGGNLTTQIRISEGGIVKLTVNIQFNVTGPPTVVTLPATDVTNTSATLRGTVSPAGFTTTARFEWGTTTAYGNLTPALNLGSGFRTENISANLSGLTCVAGTVFHYRATATSSAGTSVGADLVFTCAPQVNTFNPFDITAFGATLNGSVNPNGLATTAQYQWGLTNAYGNVTPLQSVGAGTSFEFINGGTLTGLQCSTTYHFRATATNANGTSSGNNVTFTTATCAPDAGTGVAILVGLTNATLFGGVVPNGSATNARFEWGLTTSYGNSTPNQSMGSGLDSLALTPVPISGLTCNTTYHFRVVATNSFGTSNGFDRAWVTAPCSPAAITGIVYALNGFPFTNLIHAYGVTSSGALTQLPGFPMETGGFGEDDVPERLTYDPAGRRLYAINGLNNTLSVFSVNTRTGALTAMPFSPIALPAGFWTTVRVHPSGSPVAVGGVTDENFTNGVVASYTITPTTATPAAGSPYSTGVGVYSSAFSRDGNYLYEGAGDGNPTGPSTAVFSVNASTGVLTPLGGSPFTLGGMFPIGYATDAAGRLFSVNNEGNQVRVFTTAGGVPTGATGSPFPAGGLNSAIGGVLHPAGFYMVPDESARVGVFQISGSGSATTLANVAGSPFATSGGDTIGLAVSKDGKFVFALNAETRNLTVFSVNTGTGALTTLSVQAQDTLSNFGFAHSIAFATAGSPVDDFDADGKTDPAVFRPSTSTWYELKSSTNYATFMTQTWGLATDTTVPADYDGDGKTDPAVFRPSTATWWILLSSTNYTNYISRAWGLGTDTPVPGDYDGDGKADLAVFRPSTATWWILLSSTNYTTFISKAWGLGTDTTVPGDYDGDGKNDLAVFRPSTATWWILLSSSNYTTFISKAWGLATDTTVPGDYDGDGKADLAVFRPSTANWWILLSSSNYTTFISKGWGLGTDTTVPGDYDGDGKTDLAVFRPSTGTWWILRSSTNFTTFISQAWGLGTDTPLNHRP